MSGLKGQRFRSQFINAASLGARSVLFQDWLFEVRVNRKRITNTLRLMHKEQQDDNKTKDLRIIVEDGQWKVVDLTGRTFDASGSQEQAEESQAILEQFPEYGGLAMNAAEAQLEVASHLAEARQQLAREVLACRDYLYLAKIRQRLKLMEQEMVRLSGTL